VKDPVGREAAANDTVGLGDRVQRLLRPIHEVIAAPLRGKEPFIELARRFAHRRGTVVLLSGGDADCARYDVLGIDPWLTLRGTASRVVLETQGDTATVEVDPLTVLEEVMRRYSLPPTGHALPLSAGLLGYLSYDLKDCLEALPRTTVDDLGLPHLYMTAPSVLVVHDRREGTTMTYAPSFDGSGGEARNKLAAFEETVARPAAGPASSEIVAGEFKSNFTPQGYASAVEAIRDYIRRGHVYQVNMSQRFEATFQGDPFALFARLFDRNPAPFFAYVNAGDHQLVSTSPERFVRLSGASVETRPIKGTRKRGASREEDARLRHDLESSSKDDSELSMIVDLLRNDIGKVCKAGSVHVSEHKRLEAYENVYHLVSIVRGELDEGKSAVDLIRATFPGGSITGCPKIRSTEVIDELEPVRRHVYTGSIGYLGFHGAMDLSIAIRTATVLGGRIFFSVGGGVVYDSVASDEFEETLHKGRTLMKAFDAAPDAPGRRERVAWCNGAYKPIRDVHVSVEDEGFLYGYGIFETIRVTRGVPWLLEAHLDRFARGWAHCFSSPPPDVTWRDVIQGVVERCGLSDTIAAVKILAAKGKGAASRFDGTLLVTAREYTSLLASAGRTALRLAVYPSSRQSPLGRYKTMNYMLYRMAGNWAKSRGADDAILLDSDQAVSETSTASLFARVGGKIVRPLSENALPGTAEEAVVDLLAKWGQPVVERKLHLSDLKDADLVFATNALMGVTPVSHIDDAPLAEDREGICVAIRDALPGWG
jgi:para-aminobenzoate synthetase component 1